MCKKGLFQLNHPQYNTGRTWFKKGQHYSPQTEFKKGQTACNKGKKFPHRSGEKHHNWKGGKRIVGGYLYILMPEHPFVTKAGYVRNSRLVMEKKMGRYLRASEVIHHINENTLDDRPENLFLCKNRAEHRRIHSIAPHTQK